MISGFERVVAWRYMRARRAESAISVTAWLALTAMALSVATLIVVTSVMNGFHDRLLSRILGLNGHMHLGAVVGGVVDYEALAAEARVAIGGVRAVVPIIETQALASTRRGDAQGAAVRGMAAPEFGALLEMAGQGRAQDDPVLVAGGLKHFDGPVVAIGRDMAARLRLRLGDELALTSPQMRSTPFGSVPRQGRYTVVAIFDVGMYEYDRNFVFMPLGAAQKFAGMPGRVDRLDLFLDDAGALDGARARAAEHFAGRASVWDWRDTNKGFFDTLQLEANVMFLILSLIVLISVFTIVATMVMLVKEKSGDIAVLRTMGASRAAIMRIFVAVGAGIGVAGTAAGAAGGIAFAAYIDDIRLFLERVFGVRLWDVEIRGLKEMPSVIDPSEVGAVVGVALVLSLLATLYPAWRAARTDPVEVLRYG